MARGGAKADLAEQLEHLRLEEQAEVPPDPLDLPGIYHGDEIRNEISGTLQGWCNHDHKPKIYIVTPFIDREGLQMIKASIGDHGIEALYTRNSDGYPLGPKMEGIFVEDDFVRLRVGPHNIENQKLYYHCKFIAAEFPDRVEILMTSANLTSTHFMHEQIDSVHNKYEVTPEAFKEAYLQKLDDYSHEYEWTTDEDKQEPQKESAPHTPTKKQPTTEAASGEDKQEPQKKSAPHTPIKQVQCYNCKEMGHYANECPNVECDICGERGHTVNECRSPEAECWTCGDTGHTSPNCPNKSV